MKEIFYEESSMVNNVKSATVKYNIFKGVSIGSYVFMVLWIIFFFSFATFDSENPNWIGLIILFIFPFALFLVSGILFGRMKNKLYVDYDYTFVTGSIRIAKVIKNTKRKFLFKFDTAAIEKIGKYGTNTYNKYKSMPGVSEIILTLNETPGDGKDFYYIVAVVNGDKKLMVFDCTELFIVNVLKFTNKGVLEEEFTNAKNFVSR